MNDLIKLLAALFIGAALIAVTTLIAYDIRDAERCSLNKGVWVAHNCFKRELLVEMK